MTLKVICNKESVDGTNSKINLKEQAERKEILCPCCAE
jgi:hypothetical protein